METVPCVVVEGLSDTQRRAYIHADNKLAELSSWDEELLDLDLGDLSADGLDLSAYGFDLAQAETYAALIGYQDEVESTVAESQTRTTKMVDCPEMHAFPSNPPRAGGDVWQGQRLPFV